MRAYAKVTSNYGKLWPTTDRAVRTLANSPSAKVADLGVKVRLKNCTVAKEVRVGSIARRPSINANSALAIGERGILVAGGGMLLLPRRRLRPAQGLSGVERILLLAAERLELAAVLSFGQLLSERHLMLLLRLVELLH